MTEVGGSGDGEVGAVHRVGGAGVENLRLKPRETTLEVPGISVLKALTPGDASAEMRAAFPKAAALHALATTVGTATVGAIRTAGFDVIPTPSVALPSHHRIIHPDGVAGFSDANLARLSAAFHDTTGHTP